MNKLLVVIIGICTLVVTSCGGSNSSNATASATASAFWVSVGTADFYSLEQTSNKAMAISSNGIIYVAYAAMPYPFKATVKKFDGNIWTTVGSEFFSSGSVFKISIAIDPSGTPYVAFCDSTYSEKVTVMKFNGSGWVVVGSAGFSSGQADSLSFSINSSGVPYVAYGDSSNSYKLSVMKFNGTAWVNVGSGAFSSGSAFDARITIDGSDVPYVAYEDGGVFYSPGGVTVQKFNGTSWVTLGSAKFSSSPVEDVDIAIDPVTGYPLVVYADGRSSDTEGSATVMKFNGTGWVTVGASKFSTLGVLKTSLLIDQSGKAYVAYTDVVNSSKATVMTFNGTDWSAVGTAGFTSGTGDSPCMVIDSAGALIVLSFEGDGEYGYAKIMKYSK